MRDTQYHGFWMALGLIAALAVFATPAGAAAKNEGEQDEKVEEADTRPKVRMPILITPVIDEKKRLVGYAYISMQLIVSGTIWDTREKVPFIQNRLVHEVHANPLRTKDREDESLPKRLAAAFLQRAHSEIDKKHVSEVEIEKVIFTKH